MMLREYLALLSPDPTDDDTPSASVSPVDLADALANERRQLVIGRLAADDRHSPVSLDSLADYAAERRGDGEWGGTERKREYVALYQNHVPALADVDVVEWSGNTSEPIRRGENFDAALHVLREMQEVTER